MLCLGEEAGPQLDPIPSKGEECSFSREIMKMTDYCILVKISVNLP